MLDVVGKAHLLHRRFNGDIYTLRVGSTQHAFIIHKNILNRSRVFACMTSGAFSESMTKEIVLPEDDADSFGRLVEHLYGNNDAAFDIKLPDCETAEKLADMYALAEKYQLPDFQDLIIQKLKQLDVLREGSMIFFHIVRKISENTRDLDDIFGPYFARQAAIHLESMSKEEVEELSEMICLGGGFAKKIFQIQADIYSQTELNWQADRTILEEEVAVAERQFQSATAEVAADLAKAKRMHRSQHPACGQCHVLL